MCFFFVLSSGILILCMLLVDFDILQLTRSKVHFNINL